MGKEWYFAGRSTSKRGVGAGHQADTQAPSGCMCAVFQFFDFHPFHFPNINNQQQQQHEQNSFKPPSSTTSQDHTTVPKGAEAPRNSLESEDGDGTISSLSSKEDDFKIPKNIIQIKTCGGTRASGGNDLSSEISNSPGTKTPTLVARLMGLDLLPHSPSFSSSLSTPNAQSNVPHLHHLRHKQLQKQTKHRNSIDSSEFSATKSLPETPRISSARRSDVDYHHRLSLQINKENMNLGEDFDLPRLSFSKRSKCDENNNNNNGRSPSHYARQIVKQVKESMSRKVGQDITNTLKTREEIVGQFRSKKSHKTSSLKAIDETETNSVKLHTNTSSYSPRLRLIDKHKQTTTTTTTTTPLPPLITKDQNMLKLPPPPPPVNTTQLNLQRVLTTKPKPQAVLLPEQQEFHQNKKSVPKCKKATNEKFNSRIKRLPKKQEEPFVLCPTSPTRASDIKNTKTKKTHSLSSNVPNFLPVKSDPSPPATKIPPKQSQVCDGPQESKSSNSSGSSCSQLSSCSSQQQRYKQEGTTTLATQEISDNKRNGASSTTATHPQLQYITSILARTTALNKQGTPLDPSIFNHLEHSVNDKDRNFIAKGELDHRWNRRLLFDLVDEILVGILRGKRGNREKRLWFLKGSVCSYDDDGESVEGLVERVWKRVGEFPCAKCEVLEDIDGLIEGMEREKDDEGIEEEGEEVVAEIEGNIWDTLLHETVMVMDCLGSHKLLYSEKIISVHGFEF